MRPGRRTAILALVVVTVGLFSWATSPSTAVTLAEATAAEPLLFAAVVLGLYLVRPLVLWPTTLVAIVVGYGFGVTVGIPVALAGAVFTSIAPFYGAVWLGTDNPTVARLQSAGTRWFDATGDVRGVVAGRLAPVPADAVTCAAAISGVPFRRFAAGVLLGELPWTVAAVLVGSSLHTLTVDGLGALGTRLAVVTGIAAIVLLAGPAYRYLRSDHGAAPA